MLEPLSSSLTRLLLENRLCSSADLRRCRRIVRRLAHDLPAFDSVWLDALVQLRKLTRFQAGLLESDRRDSIVVGPCLLVDRLGQGPLGETYLARPGHGLATARCVVKFVQTAAGFSQGAWERLQGLLSRTAGFQHPSIAAAHACDRVGDRVVLVTRFVEGPHLGELLVRRGRFPASVVWEVARQLAGGLASLEERGVFHGDIRLANVRLSRTGDAVLVDAGIRSALDPELMVHSGLAAERYDGIAPELIGSSRPPDARTDLYALGCLLWQLLAGRPPYPGGDPLSKLAAHQARAVSDVRQLAPDTPAPLAEFIASCTARDPQRRPASFAALLDLCGVPRPAGRHALARFRRRFDSPVPVPYRRRGLWWGPVVAALLAVTGALAVLHDLGARSSLLAWSERVQRDLRRLAAPAAQSGSPLPPAAIGSSTREDEAPRPRGAARVSLGEKGIMARGLPLPSPNEQGVIVLPGAGPYEVQSLSGIGRLVIQGQAGGQPVVRIREQAWRIAAEQVRLENVHVRLVSTPENTLPALLLVQAQQLEVERCTFEVSEPSPVRGERSGKKSAREETDEATSGPPLIAWKFVDENDPHGGTVVLRHSLFAATGPALHLARLPRKVTCENCLQTGRGALLHLAAVTGTYDPQIRLQGVTLRQSGGLLRWRVAENWAAGRRLRIEADDCVFDLSSTATLFAFFSQTGRGDWPQLLHMTGEGSLGKANLALANWTHLATGAQTPLDAVTWELSGILTAPYQFSGPATRRPQDSVLIDYDAPRRATTPPGIRLELLPRAAPP